jgi:hypothetical protein
MTKKKAKRTSAQLQPKTRNDLNELTAFLGCKSVDETVQLLLKHGRPGAIKEQYQRLKKEMNGTD